jgi:ubiquinone/menaquinone biosynthesis C-methylase UbiE
VSSYVYMKVLESAPERYDRGIHRLSRGAIDAVYERIAELAATPGRRVLDIGCGTGGVALACAARGARVTGIDINAGMLEVARGKAALAGLGDRVDWLLLGAMEIEDRFPEASLDAAVSCLVFSELLPEERSYVLEKVRSRLVPGGVVVIAAEVRPRPWGRRVWQRVRRLPAEIWTYLLTQASTHPVEALAECVRAAGFDDVTEERLAHDSLAIVTGVCPGKAR